MNLPWSRKQKQELAPEPLEKKFPFTCPRCIGHDIIITAQIVRNGVILYSLKCKCGMIFEDVKGIDSEGLP